MGQHSTPLKFHLKSRELWIDSFILIAVWALFFTLKYFLTDSKYELLSKLAQITALMASIEMIGFFALHFFGRNKGVLVQGFIGGFISSTMIFIQFSDQTKMKYFSSRDIVGALILSVIAMLCLCIVLVLTLTNNNLLNLTLPFILQIIGLILCHFLVISLIPGSESKKDSSVVEIDDPIIWKNVFKFTLLLSGILFSLNWLTKVLPDSYLITTFIISLFESHAVLAALLSNIDQIQKNNKSPTGDQYDFIWESRF